MNTIISVKRFIESYTYLEHKRIL